MINISLFLLERQQDTRVNWCRQLMVISDYMYVLFTYLFIIYSSIMVVISSKSGETELIFQ